jgi:phosphopantothenate---cysteine ligase (CTP)
MNLLVTAGNTLTPIDRVRGITNIFTGRTGAAIALHAAERGHDVMLLTSHPETVNAARLRCLPYRTFDDLARLMEDQIIGQVYDAIIHCAAVSDYRSAGIYAPTPGTSFRPDDLSWQAPDGPPRLADRAAGKVKSDEPELWLRLVRAPKLVDRIRSAWGFVGLLVKFKLEVGVAEAELREIAERSRRQSDADWMVANTLDGRTDWALLGSAAGYERIRREELPRRLLDELEHRDG